ncbi:MAG: hypothetical protein IPG68_11360 [Micrococcales bacterium]|nr:hypothetical protein [Micrococcales bacterium]
MTLTECLQNDLRDAMRERERTLVSALRSTLAAIANAQAVPASRVAEGSAHVAGAAAGVGAAEAPRRALSQDQARSIVVTETEELAAHASHLDDVGRHAQAVDVRRARDHLVSLLANCQGRRNEP